MKLSEAMRLGAMTRPQAYGDFYETRERPLHVHSILGLVVDERVASCALGAAYEAAGCNSHREIRQDSTTPFRGMPRKLARPVEIEVMETPPEWERILNCTTVCPNCGKQEEVYRLIPHLNDYHKWTREAIAAWVEGVETALCNTEITKSVNTPA